MNCPSTPDSREISLSHGQLLKIENCGSACIVCETGLVWITQCNDINDEVLSSGGSKRVSRPGKILVQAIRDSSLKISAIPRKLTWWHRVLNRILSDDFAFFRPDSDVRMEICLYRRPERNNGNTLRQWYNFIFCH